MQADTVGADTEQTETLLLKCMLFIRKLDENTLFPDFCWTGTLSLALQKVHTILIRTNLGYGTVLMVACTRQSCGASDYY
jgi:hypothetical protein